MVANDPDRRRVLVGVLDAALDAVDAADSTAGALARSGPEIAVRGERVAAPDGVTVLALGKAAPAMAAAAVEILGDLVIEGVVASTTTDGPPGMACYRGGHPAPDEGSVLAGEAMLEAARRAGRAGPGRVVLVLISGGGSAIAEVPRPGITLDDLAVTTDALLRSGADITGVNAVRKHCSALKGGRLAEAAAPARVVTLVISDVIGNPLDAVASGPTVPDPTTFADALALARDVPVAPAVLAHLRAGAEGKTPETPAGGAVFTDAVTVVVADGETAARAAVRAAHHLRIEGRVAGTELAGSARLAGAHVAATAQRLERPEMLVWCGETTVQVVGDGRGGRNQELALAAGVALDGDERVVVASLGTDGIDGPTDAAGGIGDGGTVGRSLRVGRPAQEGLDRNDAYSVMQRSGDLLICGPTGTNVGDLVIAWRSS